MSAALSAFPDQTHGVFAPFRLRGNFLSSLPTLLQTSIIIKIHGLLTICINYMAGCIAFGRSVLWRHPSFWAEEDAAQLPDQLVESPAVISSEQQCFNALASQTTPFIVCLDEATINVGFSSQGHKKDSFKRVLAAPHEQITGNSFIDFIGKVDSPRRRLFSGQQIILHRGDSKYKVV